MKTISLALLIFILGISCSENKQNQVNEKPVLIEEVNEELAFINPHTELEALIQKMHEIIERKNGDEILDLFDPEYLNEQLYDFHQGNTERFINELFCGSSLDSEIYICIPYEKITNSEILNIEEKNDGFYIYLKFASNENNIKSFFFIRERNVENKKIYFLVGAVG